MYTYNQIIVDVINSFGARALPAPDIVEPYMQCKFRLLYSDFYDKMVLHNANPSALTAIYFIQAYGLPNTDVCPDDVFSGIGPMVPNYAAIFSGKALPSPIYADMYQYSGIKKGSIETRDVMDIVNSGKDTVVVFGDPYRAPLWKRFEEVCSVIPDQAYSYIH